MNVSRLCRSMALPALMVLAGCAATGHPCFNEQGMFPDQTSSCQYGRSYHCENGDWIAYREPCGEPPSGLSSSAALSGSCEYGGISYASGSASCRAGTQYRCENSRWRNLDLPCSVGDAPWPVTPRGADCSYGGTFVRSTYAICQSGTTFLCDNGQWINLGTVCR